jgi:hypothetical protein
MRSGQHHVGGCKLDSVARSGPGWPRESWVRVRSTTNAEGHRPAPFFCRPHTSLPLIYPPTLFLVILSPQMFVLRTAGKMSHLRSVNRHKPRRSMGGGDIARRPSPRGLGCRYTAMVAQWGRRRGGSRPGYPAERVAAGRRVTRRTPGHRSRPLKAIVKGVVFPSALETFCRTGRACLRPEAMFGREITTPVRSLGSAA